MTNVEYKGLGFREDMHDPVLVNGEPLDPGPSQAVWNHSPDGFAWGYGGSGPAQLALAILLTALDKDEAVRCHQQFKRDFIEKLPQEGPWQFYVDIPAWTNRHGR